MWPLAHTAPFILLTWGLPCSVSEARHSRLGHRVGIHSSLRPVGTADGRAGLHPQKKKGKSASSLTESCSGEAAAWPGLGGMGLTLEPSSGLPLIGMRNCSFAVLPLG